jgi:hypothetical protein
MLTERRVLVTRGAGFIGSICRVPGTLLELSQLPLLFACRRSRIKGSPPRDR